MLGKAASLGGEAAAVLCGSGIAPIADSLGAHGASTVYVADDAALESPLPQPRVDVLAKLVQEQGFDAVFLRVVRPLGGCRCGTLGAS